MIVLDEQLNDPLLIKAIKCWHTVRVITILDKAQRIAERGQMGLHLADCHLERARLYLATGERDAARAHWTTAKAMIGQMGYRRRDGEVKEIEEQLR